MKLELFFFQFHSIDHFGPYSFDCYFFLFRMIFKFDFVCDFILYFFHIKFDLHSFDCSIFCLDKFFKLIFFPITYFNIKFSGN